MGKASRAKVDVSRREKIAAQRAAARKAERRKRILIAAGAIAVVVVIVVVFVVVKLGKPTPTKASGASNGPTGAALTAVVDKVTTVPASVLNAVGDGGGQVSGKPISIPGSALIANGKPEMLYIGAEYCPYCGAERWGMIVALSRFGTFTGLATVHSSSTDVYPNTPSWTFLHAKYTSKYLTFTPVEECSNIPNGGTSCDGYTTLQTPTSAQEGLITKYDTPTYVPGMSSTDEGAIPFIDFGGKYIISGASYNAQLLQNLSWSTVASDLHNASGTVAMGADGTANYITAAICSMTNNQPATACTATVKSLEGKNL
ncbi:MAG: DUF929 family protein [Streptosporangiaceae bacterium]